MNKEDIRAQQLLNQTTSHGWNWGLVPQEWRDYYLNATSLELSGYGRYEYPATRHKRLIQDQFNRIQAQDRREQGIYDGLQATKLDRNDGMMMDAAYAKFVSRSPLRSKSGASHARHKKRIDQQGSNHSQ